jgi:uncharacterized protein DUF1214
MCRSGFWSIAVYNSEGYIQKNEYDAYSLNNITASKSADGSVAVQFGGCDGKSRNCLPITPGWNYWVRLYRPRAESWMAHGHSRRRSPRAELWIDPSCHAPPAEGWPRALAVCPGRDPVRSRVDMACAPCRLRAMALLQERSVHPSPSNTTY